MVKLSIELVPSTSWFSNVRSAVPALTWDTLRKQSYRAANYQCEICGGKGDAHPVECHEVWQYDDVNHIQRLIRLISLCPRCHQVKHIGLSGLRGLAEDCIKQLMRVNKWDRKTTQEYIRESFQVWEERSKHDWTLDLSFLKRYGVDVNNLKREPTTSRELFPMTAFEEARLAGDPNAEEERSGFDDLEEAGFDL